MNDILYIASQSKGRQALLSRCGIKYEVLRHDADELSVKSTLDFENYVLSIAEEKMKHAVLPDSQAIKAKPIFLLTADTLVNSAGHILGKPEDFEDAKRMLKLISKEPILVTTGCVVEKRVFNSKWQIESQTKLIVSATVEYCLEDKEIEPYLNMVPGAMTCCGAATIEGIGENFLKNINGSYSTVIGLPIYEVRNALKVMGFIF